MRVYQELLEVAPDFTIAWYHLGVAAAQKGDHDLTLTAFRKVLERNPRSFVAYYHCGIAHFRKGDLDQAIGCFHKSLLIDPDNKKAKDNLRALEDMRLRFS
jgi:tetratricopeptide (TPR) repeat protein